MTNTELQNVLKIMIGSQEAEAMYVGSNLIWNSIPYDSRIEYLQSTGIQYIDTLFKQKDVEKFSIKYFSDNSDQPGYGNAMGCRQSSNNNEFQVTNYSSSISIGARNGNMGNDAHKINEIIYTGGNTISVNGITKNIYNVTTLTLDDTIVLFGIRQAGIPTQLENTKIYYVTLEGNGKKLELIPVRKNGVGYMYDKVSGQLFGNLGSGSFTLGPDIVEIEYLQSIGSGSGTQSIILDYIPQGNDIEIGGQFYLLGYSDGTAWTGLYGTYINEQTNVYRLIRNGSDANGSLYVHNNTRAGGGGTVLNINLNTKYSFVSTFDTFEINNTSYSNNKTSQGNTNTAQMILFGDKVMCRFYDFYIKKNNKLVCDLIPVRIGQVGYMYDKISNKLYGSSSGDFILGPDKT